MDDFKNEPMDYIQHLEDIIRKAKPYVEAESSQWTDAKKLSNEMDEILND